QNGSGLLRWNCNEGLGSSALMVLPRVALQVVIQCRDTAVEAAPIVMSCQRLLAPVDGPVHARLRRLLAAARKAGEGFGGCSRRSRIRMLSRAVNAIRS